MEILDLTEQAVTWIITFFTLPNLLVATAMSYRQLVHAKRPLRNPDQQELIFRHVSMCRVCVTSRDKSPHCDRHKMFAFSSMLFLQSISCWQVRRKMSNKCKENVCEGFFFCVSPHRSLSINSCLPSPQSRLEIASFSHLKLCCLSTARSPPNSLSGICWGFLGPRGTSGIRRGWKQREGGR